MAVVRVSGLRELRAALRALDSGLPKEITKAGRKAARIVVVAARPMVPTGPGGGGHARSSIKPKVGQRGAGVKEGGPRFPYMPWLDMGGAIHPHDGQEIHRPYIRKGRFIWNAFSDHRQEVLDAYADGLRDAVQQAGLS